MNPALQLSDNLVPGMKWMPGVYSQGWSRRRQRHGRVFQGSYKAMVVNGEDKIIAPVAFAGILHAWSRSLTARFTRIQRFWVERSCSKGLVFRPKRCWTTWMMDMRLENSSSSFLRSGGRMPKSS